LGAGSAGRFPSRTDQAVFGACDRHNAQAL